LWSILETRDLMAKIGLLSDIHCNLAAVEAAIAALDDCDDLLCAGDLMYQYRFSGDVLALLKRREVRSILGNHDKIVLYHPNHPLRSSPSVDPDWLAYLSSLPNDVTLDVNGIRLRMFHGSPWDDDIGQITPYIYPQSHEHLKRLEEIEADVIVLGHTHIPFVHDTGRARVVNPGSCAEPRDGSGTPTCAVLDTSNLEVEFRPISL
jgi:putative phosphoesterase